MLPLCVSAGAGAGNGTPAFSVLPGAAEAGAAPAERVTGGEAMTRMVVKIGAVLVAGAMLAGCASRWASPREAYTPPPTPGPPVPDAFRVLEEWRWADTLNKTPPAPMARDSLAAGVLGLFPAERFRMATGDCPECRTPEAVLWYFRDEVVAVPEAGLPMIGLDGRAVHAEAVAKDQPPRHPSLVWIGAPEIIEDAHLSSDGERLTSDRGSIPLAMTPPIPTNRTFVDESTLRFFARRPVRVRGVTHAEDGEASFVARTLWPQDADIDAEALRPEPLRENEMLGTLVEAQMGADADTYPVRLLWERAPGGARDLAGKPVVALVLSGAQGDDDGGRAGHLSVATGTFGPRGEWNEWLVDNFYPLDDPSAKGIIPASLPMDNYLFEVNSGQLYYRPSYMLVAVLREPRVASAVHSALHETLFDLYCREIDFHLSRRNSTAMSVDPLRALGWRVPPAGPTSRIFAVAAYPLAVLATFSFSTAGDLFSALSAEQTRLLPRVAFEVVGHDMIHLAAGADAAHDDLTPFERMLAEDIEALMFVHLPQVPSTRRTGTYPVRSLLTYGAQVQASPLPFEAAPPTELLQFPEGLEQTCRPGAPDD